jgi:4-hydroxy-2-oxoheptanedioate aldolase
MKKNDNNGLLDKLRKGLNVYGTCITSSAPKWPALVHGSGVDFVFLDTEHIVLDRSELASLCQTYLSLDITPIVRIPNPDPFLACQALDGGAKGVVAPYLETPDQIRSLVGATKYRPLKGEKLDRILSGGETPDDELSNYLTDYNNGNICIANIESVPAMERLDELLDVPGLDAVFIGPHDLSISLGMAEQYDHPEFERAVESIVQGCRTRDLGVGIHFSESPERQIRWMKAGVNMIIHSSDMALFSQRLNADLEIIRKASGDKNVSSGPDIIV